ncbi:MAG: hypothetical protein ACYC8T_33075 [Myxococcaceae bacterium]
MTSLKTSVVVLAAVAGLVGCAPMDKATRAETPQSAFQEGAAYDVSGTVVRIEGDKVTLAREGLPPMQLRVETNTMVTLNGYQSNVRAIPEGGQVRAKFQVIDDRPVAVRLDVNSTGGMPQQPGQPQQPMNP